VASSPRRAQAASSPRSQAASSPRPEVSEETADSEASWETDDTPQRRKGWLLGPIGGTWHKEGDTEIYTIEGTTVTAKHTGAKIELTSVIEKKYSGSIKGKEVKAELLNDGRLKWDSTKMGVWFREELDGVWKKDGGKEVLYVIDGETLTNLKSGKEYALDPLGDGKCSWQFDAQAFQGQISIIGKLRWSNDSVWLRVEGPWPRLHAEQKPPEKRWRKKPKKKKGKKTKVISGEQNTTDVADLPQLAVTIVSAKRLKNADDADGSDPFCTCEVAREDGGDPKYTFQTPTLENTLHPQWNHKHIIPAYDPEDPLEFYVWDHDEVSPDLLGSLMLMPTEFWPNGLKGEFSLEEEDGKVGEATIQLSLEVLPPRAGGPLHAPATPEPEPRPEREKDARQTISESKSPAELLHVPGRAVPEQPWSWSPGGMGARWDLESLQVRSDARDAAWRAGLQTVWRPVPVTPMHQDCRRELEHENEALRIRLAELEWRLNHDQAQGVALFSQFREFQQFEHFKRWQQSLEQPIRLR